MDEWQLVMLQKVLEQSRVKVVSNGLDANTLRRCNVEPATSVESRVPAESARIDATGVGVDPAELPPDAHAERLTSTSDVVNRENGNEDSISQSPL